MGGFTRLVREIDPRAIDAIVAVLLTLVGLIIMLGRPDGNGDFRNDDALGVALVLAQTLPLAIRRDFPLLVLTVVGAAIVVHSAIGYEIVQAGTFASLVALYGVAALTDGRRSLLGLAIGAASIAGFYITNREDWSEGDIAGTSATWALGWLLGTFVRIRGEQAEAAGARAASLELEQDARAREAVADERARMARELHDMVGHALNVIVIQASGAQRVFDARPEVPREALASIESAGREALFDMERMLGVLRATDGHDASGPQPGLAQLDGLAAHVSEAGIPVQVVIEGDQREVPASVDLSAYRIVQESLTNCLKHSGASSATVTVRYRPDSLEIEVVDNGHGPSAARGSPNGGGRGHLGMRERVAVFGGEISFGPAPSGPGFRVKARLPFKGTAS